MTFEFGSDEDIQSLGEFLRRRRQGKDLSLEDVAEKIKIHVKYLTAIEEGKDADLPGQVYKELFLKSYCDFLGVSIDELLLRLPEQEPLPPEEEGAAPQSQPARRAPYAPPMPPAATEAEVQKNGGSRRFLVATLSVLVIVLAIVAVQIYRGELFSDPPIPAPVNVPKKTEPKPEPIIADSSGTDTSSSVPARQEMINLLMVGRGECWIEVSIDGDSSFSEIMKAQDTLWLAMQDSISFKLGRANNVDVWCNAQPLALAASDDGTVKTFTLTRSNYRNFIDSTRIVP